jgi:CRP/FNR family transcriptional regulator, cyclic AMP receptor protein
MEPLAYQQLLRDNPPRRYKKGRSVVFQGEVPQAGYMVVSGIVRAYVISDEGEERTIGYYAQYDLVPPGWLFGVTNVSLYYYEAFTDCQLVTISKATFTDLRTNNHDFVAATMQRMARLYVGATLHVHALEHSRAQEKLAGILHYLVLLHSTETGPGMHQIDLRLTHQDVAGMVGLSRETASIELAKLRKKGAITYQSFTYRVNLPKLLQIMGGDEFDNVRI